MPPLTSDRNSPEAAGRLRVGKVAAGQLIFAGSMVMRNAAGFLVSATEAANLVGVGRAEQRVDNRNGNDGDLVLRFSPGVFSFESHAGVDTITDAEAGSVCFAVDDKTVAKTDDGGARSPVGFVDHIHSNGVFVRFDEAMTKNHA